MFAVTVAVGVVAAGLWTARGLLAERDKADRSGGERDLGRMSLRWLSEHRAGRQ
jgi:hypothetical protein